MVKNCQNLFIDSRVFCVSIRSQSGHTGHNLPFVRNDTFRQNVSKSGQKPHVSWRSWRFLRSMSQNLTFFGNFMILLIFHDFRHFDEKWLSFGRLSDRFDSQWNRYFGLSQRSLERVLGQTVRFKTKLLDFRKNTADTSFAVSDKMIEKTAKRVWFSRKVSVLTEKVSSLSEVSLFYQKCHQFIRNDTSLSEMSPFCLNCVRTRSSQQGRVLVMSISVSQ